MTKLTLPRFEVPPLPPKIIPAEVCDALFAEDIKHLKNSGQYRALRAHTSRQPSSIRFVLKKHTT